MMVVVDLKKYFFMFDNRLPFLWGEGYVLIRNGTWFRPHSDILRMLYSYGILAFALYGYMFRRCLTSRGFINFLPAFMAFAVNSLLDDQKLFALFLIMYSIELKKNVKSNQTSIHRNEMIVR